MAKDYNSGGQPPTTQAGELEPQSAEPADGLSASVRQSFKEPGRKWKEAVETLAAEVDEAEAKAEAQRKYEKDQADFHKYQDSPLWRKRAPSLNIDAARNSIARRQLIALLRSNTLSASGHINTEPRRTPKIEPIEWQDNWQTQVGDKLYRPNTKTTISNILIYAPAEELAAANLPESKNKNDRGAGRKPREDWPKLLGEWVKMVAMNDLPQSKAEAFEWICKAADQIDAPHPAESSFRDHIKRTLGDDFWNGLSGR